MEWGGAFGFEEADRRGLQTLAGAGDGERIPRCAVVGGLAQDRLVDGGAGRPWAAVSDSAVVGAWWLVRSVVSDCVFEGIGEADGVLVATRLGW